MKSTKSTKLIYDECLKIIQDQLTQIPEVERMALAVAVKEELMGQEGKERALSEEEKKIIKYKARKAVVMKIWDEISNLHFYLMKKYDLETIDRRIGPENWIDKRVIDFRKIH